MPTTKKPKKTVKPTDPARYVIVRCRDAGVHAGEYVRHQGREVELRDSRRIWYWTGAASLSQLSQSGAKDGSRIAVAVPRIVLTEACEIIDCSAAGEAWIRGAKPWVA